MFLKLFLSFDFFQIFEELLAVYSFYDIQPGATIKNIDSKVLNTRIYYQPHQTSLPKDYWQLSACRISQLRLSMCY